MSEQAKQHPKRKYIRAEKPSSKLPLDILPHGFAPVIIITLLISLFWGIILISNGSHPIRAGSIDAAELPMLADEERTKYQITTDDRSPITLRQTFDQKLDDYKDGLSAFHANLEYQAVLIVIALLLILRRSNKLNIFGNGVPLQWLHMLVPAVLLYFWLSFGFIFDDLIESRMRLVLMMQELNAENISQTGQILHDAHFIDGWFLTFVDSPGEGLGNWSFIHRSSVESTGRFLALFLGIWLAASHASTLAIVAIGARRYIPGTMRQRRRWYYLFPLLPASIFLVSHWQFAYGGQNYNWLQFFIALSTVAIFGLLIWLSLIVDQRVDRSSLICLKRDRSKEVPLPDQRRSSSDIDRCERVHILLMGDSLSTCFHVSHIPNMLRRSWLGWRCNWFLSGKCGSINGIDRRAEQTTYALFRNAASPTADIRLIGNRSLKDWATHTYHFAHQIDEMEAEPAPDVVAVWIGHNSMDWRESEISIEAQLNNFVASFQSHLTRLIAILKKETRPKVVVVFGLINFKSFFEARSQAEAAQASDPGLYPHINRCYRYFESLRPEYREQVIEFAQKCNTEIRRCVEACISEAPGHVGIMYSDAMSCVDISDRSYLNDIDAWHPSDKGHARLADAAWPDIEQALVWIQERWKPRHDGQADFMKSNND